MAAHKKHINLLPKDEFESSFVGKLLKWALTVGRYIVIGTELVVIGSFLSRFSLDRQLTDFNESIAQKQAIIASYGSLEDDIRSTQKRLVLIGKLNREQLGVSKFVDQAVAFTPVDVTYTQLGFSKDTVDLSGVAFSEAGFTTLLAELRIREEFERVNLKRVASQGESGGGIEFEIELKLASER